MDRVKRPGPEIPAPPWNRVPRRASAARRDPLNRKAIVAAAIRILDDGGLDGFTMRRVDDALDTGRAVFVLIEPDEYGKHPAALALRKRYALRGVASLRHGYVLRRVQPRAPEQG